MALDQRHLRGPRNVEIRYNAVLRRHQVLRQIRSGTVLRTDKVLWQMKTDLQFITTFPSSLTAIIAHSRPFADCYQLHSAVIAQYASVSADTSIRPHPPSSTLLSWASSAARMLFGGELQQVNRLGTCNVVDGSDFDSDDDADDDNSHDQQRRSGPELGKKDKKRRRNGSGSDEENEGKKPKKENSGAGEGTSGRPKHTPRLRSSNAKTMKPATGSKESIRTEGDQGNVEMEGFKQSVGVSASSTKADEIRPGP
ncbi:hypothetical protein CC86DRAFT_425880 [Ophiobolus disseminans]|uniref:Uncharacterized protein n=1 Tax=Ophiobolus disseminans TaxID=1469910 RepID=A0A6A6ZPN7_9PLEO|nr:hypothetical protein CC86DRAFT_425880 [Ophiobolus disseminans]